jgi:Pyridoxamine 5'-phosphate oxidase
MTSKEPAPVAGLLEPGAAGVTPLPWEEARARIDAARYYWLTTLHPSGRPHTRPVLAVWVGDALFTTSSRAAQKGHNLSRDPRCSVAISADDMHVVLEGVASGVESGAGLEPLADAYRAKYQWPVTVVEGGFEAPYAAPAAGPPPYRPYRITPTAVYAIVTGEALGPRHTRWRFEG